MNSFIINRLFFQLFSSWCSLNVTSRCCFFLNSFQFVHIWSEVTEIGHSWCFFFYKEKTPNKKPLCLVHSTSVNALERAASSHCWFSLWSEVGSGFFSTERGHLWTFQHEISFSTGHGSFVGNGFIFCFLQIWNHFSSCSKTKGGGAICNLNAWYQSSERLIFFFYVFLPVSVLLHPPQPYLPKSVTLKKRLKSRLCGVWLQRSLFYRENKI